jgi:MFS family permease
MPHPDLREHDLMRKRLTIRISAAPPSVVAAARDRFGLVPQAEGTMEGALPEPAITDATLTIEVHSAGPSSDVTLTASSPARIPYWGWLAGPLLRRSLRRSLTLTAGRLQAGATGTDDPPPPRPLRFAPNVAFSPDEARNLAVVCAVLALGNFGASLLGQNASYIAESFGASDRAIGAVLAATRGGMLIALIAGALADRRGRRRLILGSLIGLCIANALTAIAPTFSTVAGAQTFTRGFINALFIVGGIAAVEDAPEGARAFAVAMASLAAGFGFGASTLALALNDLGPQVWRIEFAVSALAVLLVPRLSRQLRESRRFQALQTRAVRSGIRWRELTTRRYGSRFALLAGVAFLTNVLAAPSSQFMNRYLDTVQGFSASQISGFRAVTAGIPGILGVLVAGRLAEVRGRRPLAFLGLAGGGLLQVWFFLGSGWELWVAGTASIVTAALVGVAIGALDVELFPTELRGTANALVVVVSLLGSVTGLLTAGMLADPLGGLGHAIALTALAPVLAAVFLVPRLPEAAHRALDEVSPSET